MLPSSGEVEGAQYRIDFRDSNSLLSLRLQPQYQVKAKPGSMVAMDASVQIKGKLKVSFKKMFTGGEVRSCSHASSQEEGGVEGGRGRG